MGRYTRMAGVALAMVFVSFSWVPARLPVSAAAPSGTALSGTVTSAEEGKMEGVIVNARREGATFTVSVVSNAQGVYTFPATHVGPGTYTLTVRAAGYELPGAMTAHVGASPATKSLALRRVANILPQLTSQEIANTLPGADAQQFVYQRLSCAYCHSYNRIIASKHTADQWVSIINRMASYYPDGCASSDDARGGCHRRGWGGTLVKDPNWGLGIGSAQTIRQGFDKVALGRYLASINLSGGRTAAPFPLTALPRPKGKATRVIITQYDHPRAGTVSHEMELDSKGTPWYTDEAEPYVGTLDPKTGRFTEYRVDTVPGVDGTILSLRDIVFDRDDNAWFPIRTDKGDVLAKFEVKTQRITPVPNVRSSQFIATGDGNIWFAQGSRLARLNPKTGLVELDVDWTKAPNKPADACCSYQGVVDANGNAYMGINNYVIALNGKSGALEFVPMPTKQALPRRGRIDKDGRYWFAEYFGDRIGMFDSRTKTIREWPLQKFTMPYTVSATDRKGYVYASSNMSEKVIRLDPATNEVVEYLMPTQFDSKKIAVHPAKDHTEIWMANTRNARLVKIEPLD